MIGSLQELLAHGGPTLVVIAATAAVGFGLFVERALVSRQFARQIPGLERRLRDLIAQGTVPDMLQACSKAPLGLAPVLTRGVEAWMRNAGRDHILGEMARETRRLTLQIRRGLGLLSTLGSLSPFLGLFGTVLGIMSALQRISAAGTTGLDVVAGGVSEALVDTAGGILVAMTMVLLHVSLRALTNRAVLDVQLLVEETADALSRRKPEGASAADGKLPGEVADGR